MARITQIQVRRDQSASWSSINPTLAAGEIGFELDTGKFKIGTGSNNWSTLEYATDGSNMVAGTILDSALSSGTSSAGASNNIVKYGNNGSLTAGSGGFITTGTGSFSNISTTGSSIFSNITASSVYSLGPVLNLISTASNSSQNILTLSNTSGQYSVYMGPGAINLTNLSDYTTNITIDGTSGISLQNGPTLNVGSTYIADGIIRYSPGQSLAIGNNITASGGINIGTSVATTNILGVTVFQGNTFQYQPAASAVNATATLLASTVLLGIITSTTAAAVTLTLPTGTNFENAINTYLISKPVSSAFDFSIINTGPNTVTLATATGWTLVGSMITSASTSGRFRARKTATNTFTLYRI
jgi:hypothetical protein